MQRAFTAADIREHVSVARRKRKRRKRKESGVKSRHTKREKEREEYQEIVSHRRTRHSKAEVEAKHGPEPAPLPSIARSASTVTTLACTLLESLDRLAQRSKPPSKKKKRKEGKEEVSGEFRAARPPLIDVTNQQTLAVPDSAIVLSDSAPNTPTLSPSSSSTSVSSATVTPPAFRQAAPHSTGMMSIPARLNAKQQKRDFKQELAQATKEQVLSEVAVREKQIKMVEEATKVFEQLNKTMPVMLLLLQHQAGRLGIAADDVKEAEEQ